MSRRRDSAPVSERSVAATVRHHPELSAADTAGSQPCDPQDQPDIARFPRCVRCFQRVPPAGHRCQNWPSTLASAVRLLGFVLGPALLFPILIVVPARLMGLIWVPVGLLLLILGSAACVLSLFNELLRIWVARSFRTYGRLAEFVQFNLFGERPWRQYMAIESLAALLRDHLEGILPESHGPEALELWRNWWNNAEGRLEFDETRGDWLIHPAADAANDLPGSTNK